MSASEQLSLGIGRIIVNLQSLEFALRLFLYESVGPKDPSLRPEQLSVGDTVPENPFTNYDKLGDLVRKVNKRLEARGVPDRIDGSLVDLRDSIAHGRAMALQPTGPFRLLKFSRPKAGAVQVTTAVYLTPPWVAQQVKRTFEEVNKVIRLGRSLGLACFPQ
jgi:hypothetical protein